MPIRDAIAKTRVDEHARRVVAAMCEAATAELGLPPPSKAVLSVLYVRARDLIIASGDIKQLHPGLASDLTFELYLSWLAEAEAPYPGILPMLEKKIRSILAEIQARARNEIEQEFASKPAAGGNTHGLKGESQ